MANVLKAILWVIVLALVAFLIIGRNKNKVEAPNSLSENFAGGTTHQNDFVDGRQDSAAAEEETGDQTMFSTDVSAFVEAL